MDLFYTLTKCFQIFLLSTILYHIFLAVSKYRVYKFAWQQNGRWLPNIPLIGNAFLVLIGTKVNMLSSLLWTERYFGIPINYWFGYKYHYVTGKAEDAKIVLNHPKCLDKAELYGDIHYIFRNSILLVPGQQWKGKRRYLRSAFNTNMINKFMTTFNERSDVLLDSIKKKRQEDDHYKLFNAYSFRNFFLTSFGGMSEDAEDSDITEFAHCVDKGQEEFSKLFANPAIHMWLWTRTPLGSKLMEYYTKGKAILWKSIEKKKEEWANEIEYVDNTTELPLMELLLNDGTAKESDIFEEFTLFAAGATDTTGHTLVFCFTLIGMFQDVQQKVYEEVMSVVGDREIDSAVLSKLVYTEAVISETMRIFPVIPVIGRYCSEDVNLGDKILPKGANVMVSIFHIHRSPNYWKDPLEFIPDRFLPENLSKMVAGTYLPFSSGPRNCIGQRMATVLMKITVANVVRHFKIASSHKSLEEFNLISCISMKTRNHLDLRFIPRTQNKHSVC